MDSAVLKIVSSLSILVPLVFAAMRIRKSGLFGQIFFCFLLIGLITDLSLWYVNATRADVDPIFVFNGYALIEALFFLWLVGELSPAGKLKRAVEYFLVITPFAWSFILAVPILATGRTGQSMPFVVYYEIVASFLAGFVLLTMAEKDSRLWLSSAFWFLLGVFFYCFCTFFVMTFLGKQLLDILWPLNNIINMLTYLFYTLGWWHYGKSGEVSPQESR